MSAHRAAVHLTQTPFTLQAWGGEGLCRPFRASYEAGTRQPFHLVDTPDEADFVVYCEAYQATEQTYAPRLRAERLVHEQPEKVFVVTAEDRPLGFLPGIYVSMPRPRFDDRRFRAGAYFGDINPLVAEAEAERDDHTPQLLFSFVGARTAPVRAALFTQLPSDPAWTVTETGNMQYNVGVDDPAKQEGQRRYLRTMLASAFVLCPRGFGTSSFRLFEAMRLGRAPVILADDWVAPLGPAWPDCSIRIAESRVEELPEILAARRHEAAELGRRAREEWERWFAPTVFASRCLEWIHDLQLSRTHLEADCFRRWPEMIRQAEAASRTGGRLQRTLRRLQRLMPPRAHASR